MKKLAAVISGVMFAVGMTCIAMAGSIDSPGDPSAGSGMYTLQNLYDYLMSGTALTVAETFQDPSAGPASTMKSTREIGDGIKAKFDLCNATAADVKSGQTFFCTQSGNWGVQTGTSMGGGLLKTGTIISDVSGDDGAYQKGVSFSYTLATDTVTAGFTNLMWARDGAAAGCKNGSAIAWTSAVIWGDNLVFAGYSDWRLPNARELDSLVTIGVYMPCIDQTAFPNTKTDIGYWSSTKVTPAKSRYVGFSYAGMNSGTIEKSNVFYVRAVRDAL